MFGTNEVRHSGMPLAGIQWLYKYGFRLIWSEGGKSCRNDGYEPLRFQNEQMPRT